MAGVSKKNNLTLVILLLCGIVIGGLLGELAKDASFLNWLSYGKTFGLTAPLTLDIGVMVLTFGITLTINIASIIGLIIGIIIYRLI